MKTFLVLSSLTLFGLAFLIFLSSRSAIHEIEAFLIFTNSVMCFLTLCIVVVLERIEAKLR